MSAFLCLLPAGPERSFALGLFVGCLQKRLVRVRESACGCESVRPGGACEAQATNEMAVDPAFGQAETSRPSLTGREVVREYGVKRAAEKKDVSKKTRKGERT